jgi:hypothetical protein
LTGNHPNPFNPRTVIAYVVPQPGHVTIEVCDVLGRRVCVLVDEPRDIGKYAVVWDGRDARGRPVASGVYLCVMAMDNVADFRKMLLLK